MVYYDGFLTGNLVFDLAALAWALAQGIKVLLEILFRGKTSWSTVFGTGGMPSSHSATTCALATACSVIHGPDSTQFAIAFILAFIVMYDACNVRLETGKQAVAIKELQELLQKMGQDLTVEEKLKELVGHTLPQVLVGALLGTLIGAGIALI